jgi:hypothetical protein
LTSASPSGLPKSAIKVRSRHLSHLREPAFLDVVGQLPRALADRAVGAALQQVHHDGPQEGEHGSPEAIVTRKNDYPAANDTATTNVGVSDSIAGGGLIQTTSG